MVKSHVKHHPEKQKDETAEEEEEEMVRKGLRKGWIADGTGRNEIRVAHITQILIGSTGPGVIHFVQ